MEHNLLSLDFWQNTVTYEGQTASTGAIGCAALNIPDGIIEQLALLCQPLNQFMAALTAGKADESALTATRNSALAVLKLLHPIAPFSHLDQSFYQQFIEGAFTVEALVNYRSYSQAFQTVGMAAAQMPQYQKVVLLGRLTPVLAQLGFSLRQFKSLMLPFAETLNAPDAKRTPEGFAELFGRYFPPADITAGDGGWLSMTNATVQYASVVRPGTDLPMLVKRMHFVSFVGMFRADLFEGLCVGHAPRKCPICGRWFLTTNARSTKYCGGLAPEDKLHRTCRQIGNLKGREHRELAADHPLKQLYERRCNTINHAVSRGNLDKNTALKMKKSAKNKLLRAISDNRYAQNSYTNEMEPSALLAEAQR